MTISMKIVAHLCVLQPSRVPGVYRQTKTRRQDFLPTSNRRILFFNSDPKLDKSLDSPVLHNNTPHESVCI